MPKILDPLKGAGDFFAPVTGQTRTAGESLAQQACAATPHIALSIRYLTDRGIVLLLDFP